MRTVELPVWVVVGVLRRKHPGELPAVLAGSERYVPARFEHEARRALRAELAGAGIAPDGTLEHLLTVIQRADTEFYGWVETRTGEYAALAGARGRTAVTLVRRGEQVTLGRADPEHPARSLVSLLPEVRPAPGPSISVRATDFTAPTSGGLLRQATSARPHESRRLDALLRAPRLGWAQLYAATRDRTGTRRRCADSISVLDVAHQGRWLIYRTTGGAGDQAITAVPGSPAAIAAKLTELARATAKNSRR